MKGIIGASPDASAEQAAICVLDLDGEGADRELLRRLPAESTVIAVVPQPEPVTLVELMQASSAERFVALTARRADVPDLASLKARLLAGEVFGLDRMLAAATQVHSLVVGSYQDKVRCIAQVVAFAERSKIPRSRVSSIEQCLDEMLMNALYDAAVDDQGRHIFKGIPTKTRITMPIEQAVTVEYGFDGTQFGLCVRDMFGTLDRQTVVRVLHKCLHAKQQVDNRTDGAGVGLYLMLTASTRLAFHVVPKVATEVICVFDVVAPSPQLAQFEFLRESTTTQPLALPPRRPSVKRRTAEELRRIRRRNIALLAAGGVAVLAALLVALWPRPAPPPPPVATVTLDSQPAGVAVEIDGTPMGGTPITLTTLKPRSSVALRFTQRGYQPAAASLQVPAGGQAIRHVQPLVRSSDFVRVRFVSNPSGARVFALDAQGMPKQGSEHTYTPAEIFVEVNQLHRYMVAMPNHVPVAIPPFTPARGDGDLELRTDLVEGPTLAVEAAVDGEVTIRGAALCNKLETPADCALPPGTYVVDYLAPNKPVATRTVTLKDQDTVVAFD